MHELRISTLQKSPVVLPGATLNIRCVASLVKQTQKATKHGSKDFDGISSFKNRTAEAG